MKKLVVPVGPKKEVPSGQIPWQPEQHLAKASPLEEDQVYPTMDITGRAAVTTPS